MVTFCLLQDRNPSETKDLRSLVNIILDYGVNKILPTGYNPLLLTFFSQIDICVFVKQVTTITSSTSEQERDTISESHNSDVKLRRFFLTLI